MKKKLGSLLVLCVLGTTLLTACGGDSQNTANSSYKDGTYEGKSSVYTNDEENGEGDGYGVVTLTIEGGKLTACTYQTYTVDGELKDTEYGKQNGEIANRDYYNKAQKAVAACEKYAQALVEGGNLKNVDSITGATVNYKEFIEAVENALEQAV